MVTIDLAVEASHVIFEREVIGAVTEWYAKRCPRRHATYTCNRTSTTQGSAIDIPTRWGSQDDSAAKLGAALCDRSAATISFSINDYDEEELRELVKLIHCPSPVFQRTFKGLIGLTAHSARPATLTDETPTPLIGPTSPPSPMPQVNR